MSILGAMRRAWRYLDGRCPRCGSPTMVSDESVLYDLPGCIVGLYALVCTRSCGWRERGNQIIES